MATYEGESHRILDPEEAALLQQAARARQAELARQAEVAKLAELTRQAELARQAERARQAELAEQAKRVKEAERAQQAELEKHAQRAKETERARQAELAQRAKRAEEKRRAEQAERARQDELAKQADRARQAELAQRAKRAEEKRRAEQAERARQDELAEQAERAREAERAKQEELAKQAERARQAELAQRAKQAEEERRAEQAERARLARQAERERRAELAQQAKRAKKAERAQQAQLAQRAKQAERARRVQQAELARQVRQAQRAARAERAERARHAARLRRAARFRDLADRLRTIVAGLWQACGDGLRGLGDHAKRLADVPSTLAGNLRRGAESLRRSVDQPRRATVGPRRVLILVENLPSPFDRRVWQEATALRDAGYLVSIICPTGKGYEQKFEDIGGIHIWRYDLPLEAHGALGYAAEYAVALARTWVLCWRVLVGRGFDVVHACNPPDLLFLIGGFFKLLGKKFVFDHHDINPELYVAKFGRRDLYYRLLLWLERWSFRTADVSIATNESYRRIAIGRGGKDSDRVFVVRSGPSLERMKVVPPDERHRHGRRYLVGYVGVMGKQEGIDCLLRAVRLIVSRHGRKDIHFGLVGGGTSLEEMKALARDLDVAEYVTFTGRVPDSELLAVLNTADVCVNPDVPSEMNDKSTMNKIMEYMALGKPIVQFDLAEGRYSARGAALNARPHDIADFAAKILQLIDDPALRERMGAIGRERVLNVLSWDHEVPKLLAAYECLWSSAGEQARQAQSALGTFGSAPASPPAPGP